MSGDVLATAAAAAIVLLLAAVAYARGRRGRPALLPPELIGELSHHKLDCLHEPAERVALEIALLAGGKRVPRVACGARVAAASAQGRDVRRS